MKVVLNVSEQEKLFLKKLLVINNIITRKDGGEPADNLWKLVNDIAYLKKEDAEDISDLIGLDEE